MSRTPHSTHFGVLPFPRSSRRADSPAVTAVTTLTRLSVFFATLFARLSTSAFDFLRSYFVLVRYTFSPQLVLPPYQVIDGRTVFSWRDQESDAVGWIVIDNPFPTVAGGGLFMHSGASLKEVTDVASAMSYKLTVGSQPQVVGAKGGIRYNHRAADASAVLERFVRDNAAVINQYWGTGGDLNTSHAEIDRYVHRHAGVECALGPIARGLGSVMSITDILRVLQTKVPMHGGYASLEEASVGYGAAIALRKILLTSAPHRMGDTRVVLQGLGTVGATFAHYIKELGIGKVVGVSSQFGYYIDQDGIDVDRICIQRQAALSLDQSLDPKLLETGLTPAQLTSSAYYARLAGSTDDEHLCSFLSTVRADIFAPCAGRYVVSPSVLKALDQATFENVLPGERFIIAGANNIMSPSRDESTWLAALDDADISMLPEWISNSGTASVFMRACSGNFTLDRPEVLLTACGQDIERFLERVCRRNADMGSEQFKSSHIFATCYDVARETRVRGEINRFGVERIAHVNCITAAPERAYETFNQVIGAQPMESLAEAKMLQLPGADDPSFSITPAPKDATPADTGLHVFFAVTNLARTRAVLMRDGLAFTESTHADHGVVLEMNGEMGGYPMGFVQATGSPATTLHEAQSTVMKNVGVKQLDHYTLIVPDADAVQQFHEDYMGYSHLRTIALNAGSAPDGEDDMLNHVMALPNDNQRVMVVTEGLNPASVFSRLLERKHRPYVHHVAMQVSDVNAAFDGVRAAGWGTTSDKISHDMLSGLRQFFIREEEVGCFVELIERASGLRKAGMNDVETSLPVREVSVQGEFKKGNMASLAQSMESYVRK